MSDSPSILARALDPRYQPPTDPMSEKILDAAMSLIVESGLRHLTVDDVAQRAGVGRITVYRRFTDKQGLIEALMLRETRRQLLELRRMVNVELPPETQIVEGFVASLKLAREHPLLDRMIRLQPDAVLSMVTRNQVFALMRAFLAAQIRAAKLPQDPENPIDIDLVAELVVRLGVSFLLIPDSVVPIDDPDALRAFARRAIVPMITR